MKHDLQNINKIIFKHHVSWHYTELILTKIKFNTKLLVLKHPLLNIKFRQNSLFLKRNNLTDRHLV
jgi:hypothetical protein